MDFSAQMPAPPPLLPSIYCSFSGVYILSGSLSGQSLFFIERFPFPSPPFHSKSVQGPFSLSRLARLKSGCVFRQKLHLSLDVFLFDQETFTLTSLEALRKGFSLRATHRSRPVKDALPLAFLFYAAEFFLLELSPVLLSGQFLYLYEIKLN